MKKIKHYVKHIEEELCDAQDYAEKYLENKADGKIDRAEKYKGMAEDELEHSVLIHEMAVDDINKLKQIYTAPADMVEKWELSHEDYIKKSAYIKSLLSL